MSPQSFSVVPSSGPLRPSLTGTAAARSVASSHDEAGSASGTFDAALAGLDCVPDQKLGNAPSLASSPPPPSSPKSAPSLSSSSSSSARPHDVGAAVVAPKPASLASPTSPLVAAVGPHQAPSPSSARPHDVGVSVVASKPASPTSPLVAAVGPQQAPSLPLAPQLQPALPARNADSVMSRVNQGPLEARRSSSSSSSSSSSLSSVAKMPTPHDLTFVVGELRTRLDVAVSHAVASGEVVGAPCHEESAVGDTLWSEHTTVGRRDARPRDDVQADDRSSLPTPSELEEGVTMSEPPPPTWSLAPMSSSTAMERVEAVREVPPGPLMVAVDHVRALLPEGGRVLHAEANNVRLEVPHASGAMVLEISLRSGVVDVRARGGAAAEMAWRIPELAAALQSAGVRLGAFEVQAARKSRESSNDDNGQPGDRQNSDGTAYGNRRSAGHRVVASVDRASSLLG